MQAEPTSNAPAPVAPSAWATSGAVPGIISSDVVVATITRSTSEAATPARASAARADSVAWVVQALVGARDAPRVDPGAPRDPVVVDAEAGADLRVGDDGLRDADGDRRHRDTGARLKHGRRGELRLQVQGGGHGSTTYGPRRADSSGPRATPDTRGVRAKSPPETGAVRRWAASAPPGARRAPEEGGARRVTRLVIRSAGRRMLTACETRRRGRSRAESSQPGRS